MSTGNDEPNQLRKRSVRPKTQHEDKGDVIDEKVNLCPLSAGGGHGEEGTPVSRGQEENMGVEQEAIEVKYEGGEERKPKTVRSPSEPTKKEREEHSVTHVPFRDWCQFCIQGRGVESPHRQSGDRSEDTVPLIAGDYGFPGDKRGEDGKRTTVAEYVTLLALGDSRSQSTKAIVVPRKGHPSRG